MPSTPFRTRLRAATLNAVLWGGAFFAASFALLASSIALGQAPDGIGLLDAVAMAVRIGVWGGLCGLVFSAAVGLRFTGSRLAEIRVLPVLLGSAVGIGVFVPLALQTLNLISGDGLVRWSLVLDDGLRMGLIAGVAAGLTLKLAQVADRILPPGVRSEEELLLRNADAAIAAAEIARRQPDPAPQAERAPREARR